MMLYKSQHLQKIIREITYSGNTEILVVFGSADPELASFWTLDSFY